jgi:hypothetical protein
LRRSAVEETACAEKVGSRVVGKRRRDWPSRSPRVYKGLAARELHAETRSAANSVLKTGWVGGGLGRIDGLDRNELGWVDGLVRIEFERVRP